MKLVRRVALFAAAVGAFACAAPSGSGSASPRPSRSDVITAEEMRNVQATNLYDVVKRLHPEWLLQRNASALGPLNTRTGGGLEAQVFMGGQHTGGLDMLRQLSVGDAGSLHYYTAAQAENKFGTGYPNGVIEVLPPGR